MAVGKIATAATHFFGQHDMRGQIGFPSAKIAGHGACMRREDSTGEEPSGLHHLPAGIMHSCIELTIVPVAGERVCLRFVADSEIDTDQLRQWSRGQLSPHQVPSLIEQVDAQGAPKARDLPKFPMVRRDIAMLVEEGLSSQHIIDTLLEASNGLAESVVLFDLYRGEHVPAGQKSLAFRVVYRDPGQTLTDKRVDKAHAQLGKMAREALGATLR